MHLTRICVLLLLDEMFCIYALRLPGLTCLFKTDTCLLIFCLDDLYSGDSCMLIFLTIILFLHVFPFTSVHISFIC